MKPRSIIAAAALLCLAAAPATQPKAKPSDANTVAIEAAVVHAHFRVPKTWQRKETIGPVKDRVFAFDPAPASKKGSSFVQLIQIYLDHPKDSQKSLADVVADLKTVIQKHDPKLKFTKDAETTFAGRKVWQLQWLQQLKAQISGTTETTTLEFDRCEMVWLENGEICEFGFHADQGFLPSLMKKGEDVAKTLTFDK